MPSTTNGTAIGEPDRRITRAKLSASDVVYFGSLRVMATRLLTGQLAIGDQPLLVRSYSQRSTVFGRGTACDRVLDDPTVSRRHACLLRVGSELSIDDLGSTNGTFVNGRRISGSVRSAPATPAESASSRSE